MSKPLTDSVGHIEYILLGLTFLGVLYLVMKEAKITVKRGEGLVQSAGTLGYHTITDSATHRGSNRDGMGSSIGAFEPPVFHLTPYDANELAGAFWNISDDSDPDYTAFYDADQIARLRAGAASSGAPSSYNTKFTMGTEGMRTSGYSKARYNGMSNKELAKSMVGL